MSARESVVATVYFGQITAQVRLHFPADTHPADVRHALAEALQDAYRRLAEVERAER